MLNMITARYAGRFWEIDFWRGCAVTGMIIYHLVYNLFAFGSFRLNPHGGFWLYFQRGVAISFITLVGISLSLGYSRLLERKKVPEFSKYARRGGIIFFYGLVITIVTYFFLGDWYVRFGVLHCIGISIILGYFFLRFYWLNLVLGTSIITAGWILYDQAFHFSSFTWLGFRPYGFYTVDYFPLLPWFGVVLVGIFLGKTLYPGYRRRFQISDYSTVPLVSFFNFCGQHSLVIYLLHQPALIAVLALFGLITFTW